MCDSELSFIERTDMPEFSVGGIDWNSTPGNYRNEIYSEIYMLVS